MKYWFAAVAIVFGLLFLGGAGASQCPEELAPIKGGADPLDNGGCAPVPPVRP